MKSLLFTSLIFQMFKIGKSIKKIARNTGLMLNNP